MIKKTVKEGNSRKDRDRGRGRGRGAASSPQKSSINYLLQKRIMLLFFMAVVVVITVGVIYKLKTKKSPSAVELNEDKKTAVADTLSAPVEDALSDIISIRLSPPEPVKGDSIRAEVTTRSKDAVAYQWAVNGEVVNEASDLLTADLNRGDKVSLTVTPGKGGGEPVTVFSSIFNSAPVITSTIQDARFAEDTFEYQVRARDADNDALRYSLKFAPDGMSIDPVEGLITWLIPPELKGSAEVIVSVKDSEGGEETQTFSLQLEQRQ